MGFFSWNCKRCEHPMLSSMATEDKNKWMTEVVVLEKDGTLLKGEYDGYGRVNDRDINYSDDPECYHRHCWEKAGKPIEHTEPSTNANDQGWFFEDNVHNINPPN